MLQNKKRLIEFLETFITEDRLDTFSWVLKNRTRYITVVLENIFQPQNASAVLRSCDCFGVQNVHIIENYNEFNVNPDVALGSAQWLNLEKYNKETNNTLSAIKKLKSDGYRIVATTPHENDVTLNDFDLEKGKIALMFGTEQDGLSDIAMENADEFMKIPMYGFTESFNISVSAAIILNQLITALHKSNIEYKLDHSESLDIKIKWLVNTLRKPKFLFDDFCKKNNLELEDVLPPNVQV